MSILLNISIKVHVQATFVYLNFVDFDKLKLACQMITLDKCHLDVEKVPITKSVVVRGFGPNTSQDALEFYFNNRRRSGGTGVLETKMIAEEGVCIVSFEEPEGNSKLKRRVVLNF